MKLIATLMIKIILIKTIAESANKINITNKINDNSRKVLKLPTRMLLIIKIN